MVEQPAVVFAPVEAAAHLSHWYVNDGSGVPDHVPTEAWTISPTCGWGLRP